MTTEEIREIAIDSCQNYYEYLQNNNKGIQEVDVFDLEYLPGRHTVIKLRLSAKLFDTEAVFFRNFRNGKDYDSTEIKIIEYDNDKNILLIKPSDNISPDFTGLHKNDLKVVSDLKFLVERVKDWYVHNGSKLSLPTRASKYSEDFQNIDFFPEKNLQPSENQKQSLKNIFTSPFSYIWGAPGTGKTQFVLAYAVLHYIKKGDTIAILAPTNNAIEQVLKGIIKMTDKAGIDRKQIIRLGTPSKKFAEEFPEVCEEKGVQKKLAEIDKQIDILERMLNFQNQQQAIDRFINLTPEFDDLIELSERTKQDTDSLAEVNIVFRKKEIDVKLLSENSIKEAQQLEKNIVKINSISHKIIKAFSSKPTRAEKEVYEIRKRIYDFNKDLEYSKYELSEISKKRTVQERDLAEIQKKVSVKITNLIDQTKFLPEVQSVLSKLSVTNIKEIKKKADTILLQKRDKLEVDTHLFSEYKNHSSVVIESELERYLHLRAKLAISSTEERLKSVNIIACTLDGYIGRYAESKLNVEHIFLDEAGYANIIKALTLFNHSTPISFLGDHKQLPPVCEINDSSIERDGKFYNMFLWAQSAIFLDTLFSKSKDFSRNQYLDNSEFKSENISKTSLNATYRFGNNLAQILSKHVYENDFSSNNPKGETQIQYINAKKAEGPKSRVSMNEVSEISKLVHSLKKNGTEDFVILTPYKKQIRLLNNSLPQERNDLKILTVHGSQGREWDTVILSIVDTYDKWFVDTTIPISKGLNLVNTAVSRAKRNLIVVCDKNYWAAQSGQLVTELINCGKEIKN
ncbi:DEAD/DEAH box helicase [Chryseobacterium indologenes]|uniref:DEAD/DEAH box helicase n=1 Tax=Chryseobacterium indologenes TaxID=253 RepID=UPI003016A0B3